MSDAVTLSRAQRDVLEWLYCYPGVEIQFADREGSRASWTSKWVSPEARDHLRAVTLVLGETEEQRAKRCEERLPPSRPGTPPLTTPTIRVLIRQGLVRVTRMRPPDGGYSETFNWQLSHRGKFAIIDAMIAADLWEFDEPEDLTKALAAIEALS
jgi:hypothetical protein